MAAKTKRQLASEVRAYRREAERKNEQINGARMRLSAQGIGNATLIEGVTDAVQKIDTLERELLNMKVEREREAALRDQSYQKLQEWRARAELAEKTAKVLLRVADKLTRL